MNGRRDLLDPSTAIRAAVLADPQVRSVDLIGSRATGTATELSDWDYRIASSDSAAVAARLPGLVAVLRPLGQLWDPLARTPVYMIILPGAVKADLFPGARIPRLNRKDPPGASWRLETQQTSPCPTRCPPAG